MSKKTIKIAVRGAETVPYENLKPFQGNLKHIGKDEYERLRKGILELGFSFVPHVWKEGKDIYLIDGHQRIFTVRQMAEIEGYKIPPIPVAVVEAKTFAEAKRKILAAASQYGMVSKEGLLEFAKENDIPLDEIVATFHFPEVDFAAFASDFTPPPPEDLPEVKEDEDAEKTMKSGSELVRQLQLFFNSDDYNEFVQKVEALRDVYKTESVTDTLLGMVREEYSANFEGK